MEKKVKHACMVAYSFYDSDNRVRRYAETLIQAGWNVDVIVLRDLRREREYVLNGVRVIGIQKRNTNEKRLITYLIRLLIFLFKSCVQLSIEHIRYPYTVVHIHSIPDFEVFSAIVPKLAGSKIILDIHDIVPELFLKKFNNSSKSMLFKLLVFIERISMAFADHVIIANDIWRERVIARSVPPQKCSVVMNYPVPEIFDKKSRTRGNDNKFILIYPGTLSQHQGIETAIKAVNILKDKIPSIEFQIYGRGTDEEQLVKLTDQLNLREYIKFSPVLPMEQISSIMMNADIGIEPKLATSFSDEAFSTKILEFLYLGVPVIASDTTVHKYYIPNNVVEYFPSGNVEVLADTILKLYNNPVYRQELVQRASVFIKDFSWDRKKEGYLKLVGAL